LGRFWGEEKGGLEIDDIEGWMVDDVRMVFGSVGWEIGWGEV
jgi:hypothetical protein